MAKASPRAGTEVLGLCLWLCVRDLNHFPNAPQHGGSALAATWPLQGPAVPPGHWGRTFGNIWPSPGSTLARAQFGLSLPLRRASPCPAPCILDVGHPQPRQAGPPGPVLQHPSCRLPPPPPSCLSPRLSPRIPEDFVRVPQANITPTLAQTV